MIPKKIFQTWKSKKIHKDFQKIIDSWRLCNKNYEYIFFDDNDCRNFLKKFDKKVYAAYEKIIPGAFKADLWRLCVLYQFGGFYSDIDTLCIGSIDNFINKNINFIIPIDLNLNEKYGKHNLFNSFIGSTPNNIIIKQCIDQIIFNVENNLKFQSLLDFSACGLIGRIVNKFIGRNETESFIGFEGVFGKIHFLKFEPTTEYVGDIGGNVLFQNKNGNHGIKILYKKELERSSIRSWTEEEFLIKKYIKHL